ncbi:NifB/NifX family molybdenum-iron cluster-binding protein [Candidatus Electronema sp. JM]|uniref:NifB/NifX family molybdenum-iron cluster-binding protein n=1 Tax=Candidatus Electronema sp. JM TaxID=3401571 RepID=UPI003AA8D201
MLQYPQEHRACPRSMRIESLLLPIAPQAVCGRRFGGGKAAAALPPAEAAAWLDELLKGGKSIGGVTVCGPGDALAAPEILFAALDLIRAKHPEFSLRVTAAGLGAAALAPKLAERNIAEISLQVEAVAAEIAEKIYTWIRPGKRTLPLAEAAAILISEQEKAVAALAQAGLKVTIQTTVYPGINDEHVTAIAEKMVQLGASSMTLLPFTPVPEEEGAPPACSVAVLDQAKAAAAAHLALAEYDATLLTPPGSGTAFAGTLLPKPTKERPNVAVVSSSGMEVDLHLGQAEKILIYGPRGGDELPSLLTVRDAQEAGAGTSRWETLARECLFDCFALLAAKAGENPQKVLAEQGIKVLLAEDSIDGLVDVLYGGGKKQKCKK